MPSCSHLFLILQDPPHVSLLLGGCRRRGMLAAHPSYLCRGNDVFPWRVSSGESSESVNLSCVPLFGTPWSTDRAPLSMEFSRQDYWSEGVIPFQGSSQPRDRTQVPCIAGRFFTSGPPATSPRGPHNCLSPAGSRFGVCPGQHFP